MLNIDKVVDILWRQLEDLRATTDQQLPMTQRLVKIATLRCARTCQMHFHSVQQGDGTLRAMFLLTKAVRLYEPERWCVCIAT